MKYEIVRYTSEHAPQVAELQTHHWHRDVAVNRAHFEWKYLRNPFIAPAIVHLAIADGRVVGMRGMFGSRWEVGGPADVFVVPCAGDLVILPEHRNVTLLMRIIHASVDDLAGLGYDYVFNLSARSVTQLASLRAGWRSVGPVETATRSVPPLPPGRTSRTVLRDAASRWPAIAAAYRRLRDLSGKVRPRRQSPRRDPFAALDRAHAAAGPAAAGGLALEATPRPAAMAALVNRLPWDGRLRQVRDATYLAWRYASPRSRFRFLFAGATDLDGYLVLRASTYSRTGRAEIVDWEATSLEVRTRLLAAAIAWGGFPELAIWSATLAPEVKAALRGHGFHSDDPSDAGAKDEHRSTVLVRAVDRDRVKAGNWSLGGRPLLDLASWDLRMIYRDI